MQTEANEVLITVIIGTTVLLVLIAFLIYFLFTYQKRQLLHREEKIKIRQQFEQELLRTTLEVQQQTLNEISGEMHDNVGQTLSVARLYLSAIQTAEQQEQEKIAEINNLLGLALQELRSLSHVTNSGWLQRTGLIDALRIETERISRSKKIKAIVEITDDPPLLNADQELILFRICQEALTNALKHAAADSIKIGVHRAGPKTQFVIADNGNGKTITAGNGVTNMQRRAAIIGGALSIDSEAGKGTRVIISFPVNEN